MRQIIVLAFAVAFVGPVAAADLNATAPYNSASPYGLPNQAAFSWAGTYFGVNVGGAGGNVSFSPLASPALGGAPAPFSDPSTVNDNAVVGGFQVGRNWQFGSWVLGIEHQMQFTKLNGSITASPAIMGPFVPGDNFTAKIDYLGATRGRLGYAWNNVLVYAAAGLETGGMDATGNYISRGGLGAAAPLNFSDTDKLHVGYTVGVGVEYAVTDRVSLGVEYNYLTLNRTTYNLGTVASAAGAVNNVTADVGLTSSEVLVRLNVKLNSLKLLGF